jgi:predicted dehydrogenase
LKRVKAPLLIVVYDPSEAALRVAQERYDEASGGAANHKVVFTTSMPQQSEVIDIAIVATNADVRAAVLEALVAGSPVRNFILEKWLCQTLSDLVRMGEVLRIAGANAWVNCGRRTMPFYEKLKEQLGRQRLNYSVTGSNWGLATSSIHFIDQIASLTGCLEFEMHTADLDRVLWPSKRPGFCELSGSLEVRFLDGSRGTFTSYAAGDAPAQIVITAESMRAVIREWEQKAWIASPSSSWRYEEVDAKIPFQSEMTTWVVERLLAGNGCFLPSFEESTQLHRTLISGLESWVRGIGGNPPSPCPFT